MKIFPSAPILKTVEHDGKSFVCLDAVSEETLQNQRLVAMLVGSPAVIYAGMKLENPIQRAFVVGMGVACLYSHYTSYQLVDKEIQFLKRKQLARQRSNS